MGSWFKICDQSGGVPAWARRFYVDDLDVMFIPAALAASEMEVALCASYDGIEGFVHEDHIYLPASWIAKVYPRTSATIAHQREQLEAFLKAERRRDA